MALVAAVAIVVALVSAAVWQMAVNQPAPPVIYVIFTGGPETSTPAQPSGSAEASTSSEPSAGLSTEPSASAAAPTPEPPGGPGVIGTLPIGANLTVSRTDWVPFFCGEQSVAIADVTNVGSETTSASAVVRMIDTYAGHEAYWAAKTVPILAPTITQSVRFDFTLNAGCGADHVISFRIDPENVLPEATKLDNMATIAHHVSPAGPNLVAMGMTQSPSHSVCMAGFDVSVNIQNMGGLATPRTVTMSVTDTAGSAVTTKTGTVPVLASHDSTSVSVHITPLSHCNEDHLLTVLVDSGGAMAETHEDDNTLSSRYHLYSS